MQITFKIGVFKLGNWCGCLNLVHKIALSHGLSGLAWLSEARARGQSQRIGLAWLAEATAWLGWLLASGQGRQNTIPSTCYSPHQTPAENALTTRIDAPRAGLQDLAAGRLTPPPTRKVASSAPVHQILRCCVATAAPRSGVWHNVDYMDRRPASGTTDFQICVKFFLTSVSSMRGVQDQPPTQNSIFRRPPSDISNQNFAAARPSSPPTYPKMTIRFFAFRRATGP
ncbi:hypothetical protein R3P38DRAFT_3360456, partial [Favolaschia claudopus]